MRKKEASNWQKPPPNLSAAGMNSWHLQQRQREQELRERRREAEMLLRGYRMTMSHNKVPEAEKKKYRDFSSRKKLFHSGMPKVGEAMVDPNSDEHEKLSDGSSNKSKVLTEIGEERVSSDCAKEFEEKEGGQLDALKSKATPSDTKHDANSAVKDKTLNEIVVPGNDRVMVQPKVKSKTDKIEWREFVEPGRSSCAIITQLNLQ